MRPLDVLIQLPELERQVAMATGEFSQALERAARELMHEPPSVVCYCDQGCLTEERHTSPVCVLETNTGVAQ